MRGESISIYRVNTRRRPTNDFGLKEISQLINAAFSCFKCFENSHTEILAWIHAEAAILKQILGFQVEISQVVNLVELDIIEGISAIKIHVL